MGWSDKYKRSIDCNNPKGFSQKAHCAGRKIRKENMKLSELKNTIRDLIQERSINAISKLQQKNIEDVQRTLDLYKKVKSKGDAKQIKKYIDVLKKLGKEKEKLAKELDDKVSGMYRDAEYKGESVVKELNISKDDMEKLHKDGEVEIGGEKVTFQNEGSINEGPSSEEKRIAMLAVRKQAKYRNVDLASAIQDQINALKELQRDVKRGKVK
jgi:hypothetical protein